MILSKNMPGIYKAMRPRSACASAEKSNLGHRYLRIEFTDYSIIIALDKKKYTVNIFISPQKTYVVDISGTSNEYPQQKFSWRNKKKSDTFYVGKTDQTGSNHAKVLLKTHLHFSKYRNTYL